MARIRTIKPEFWTDSKTGTLTEFSKCLFLGLLNHADDYGVLNWDPMEWRAKIFPYHSDTTPRAVGNALSAELLPRGLVTMFTRIEDDETRKVYVFVPNFHKHQVINKPSRPLLANWKLGDTPMSYAKRTGCEFEEIGDAPTGPIPPPPSSTTGALPAGKERKGEEGKGKEKEVEGARPLRGSRLPPDWVLSEDWRSAAASKRAELGLPLTNLDLEAEKFRNHWHAQAGAKGVKLDWQATWMNWCLRADAPKGSNGKPVATAAPRIADDDIWRTRLKAFKERHFWSENWGHKPGTGCDAPPSILTEFGLSP